MTATIVHCDLCKVNDRRNVAAGFCLRYKRRNPADIGGYTSVSANVCAQHRRELTVGGARIISDERIGRRAAPPISNKALPDINIALAKLGRAAARAVANEMPAHATADDYQPAVPFGEPMTNARIKARRKVMLAGHDAADYGDWNPRTSECCYVCGRESRTYSSSGNPQYWFRNGVQWQGKKRNGIYEWEWDICRRCLGWLKRQSAARLKVLRSPTAERKKLRGS